MEWAEQNTQREQLLLEVAPDDDAEVVESIRKPCTRDNAIAVSLNS